MTEPTISQRLAAWACDLKELPDEVRQDVKRRMLDSLGIQLASSVLSSEGSAVAHAVSMTSAPGPSTVVGLGGSMDATSAALINGVLAHSLDFDDTHLPSVLHPSANIVPAVLSVAQAEGIEDDERILAAVAVGIEITNRLGMGSYDASFRNSVMFEHGFHATSICGAVGAAAATGLLLGMDEGLLVHSMGIAASMGSGLLEANRTGGSVKKTHCGWAAQSGIRAAQFAQAGVTGPPTVFEGRFGFYEAFGHGFLDAGAIVNDLGERWETLRTHFKPYPSNHFTHPLVDAALELKELGLCADDIASVSIGVAGPTLRTIAQPPELKARPASPYAAQFSGPFVFAQALVGGGGLGVYVDDFTPESISNRRTLDVTQRVTCYADEDATEAFPNDFRARVSVTTVGGKTLEAKVDKNRGGPDRPLSEGELSEKFRLNAGHRVDVEEAMRLEEVVLSFGTGASSSLFRELERQSA